MNNELCSPKDIDFPENLTGTITVDEKKRSVIYEFENGKLKSVEVHFEDVDVNKLINKYAKSEEQECQN